jgi:hypothetical protein
MHILGISDRPTAENVAGKHKEIMRGAELIRMTLWNAFLQVNCYHVRIHHGHFITLSQLGYVHRVLEDGCLRAPVKQVTKCRQKITRLARWLCCYPSILNLWMNNFKTKMKILYFKRAFPSLHIVLWLLRPLAGDLQSLYRTLRDIQSIVLDCYA